MAITAGLPVGVAAAAAGGGDAGVLPGLGLLVERLRAGGHRHGTRDLFSLLVSLSRGIDYALSRNEVPKIAKELPSVVRMVNIEKKDDTCLLSAIMVLMNSIQNACRCGWFNDTEVGEFNELAKELYNCFSSGRGNFTVEPTVVPVVVSEIMPSDHFMDKSSSSSSTKSQLLDRGFHKEIFILLRFFPHLELGKILVSIEAKPGYEVLMADFLISKSSPPSSNEKIGLLVAQKDNIETSSCIINPPEVNFLVNGRGVENRTPGLVTPSPQLPSDVTHMLVYGTNLLQVVGQFNGNYIIVLACMSSRLKSDFQASKEQLLEYTSFKAPEETKSDEDIIEGPSRISLKCPISFKRMKTPVKGHLCRHHQCFDHDNFVEMNTRSPSWRCPHCNQSVGFYDLRIDRNMVEVLSQVGDDVEDVLISADGSWKISSKEFADYDCQLKIFSLLDQRKLEADMQADEANLGNTNAENSIVDLTMDDVDASTADFCVRNNNDTKLMNDLQPSLGNFAANPVFNTFASAVQDSGHVAETCDDIWSRLVSMSGSALNGAHNPEPPSAVPTTATYADNMMRESFGIPQSINHMSSNSPPLIANAVTPSLSRAVTLTSNGPATHNPAPVIADSFTPALRQADPLTSAAPAIQHVETRQLVNSVNNVQLLHQQQQQHFVHGNSVANIGEIRQRPLIPRQIARTPIAVQALPAQPLGSASSGLHRRSSWPVYHEVASSSRGPVTTNVTHGSASLISPIPNNTFSRTGVIDMERPWTYLRSVLNPLATDMASTQRVVAPPATNSSISSVRGTRADLQQQRVDGFGKESPPVFPVLIDNHQSLNRHSVTPSFMPSLPQQSFRLSAPPPANNLDSQLQYNQRMGPLASKMLVASQLGMATPGARVPHGTSSMSGTVDGVRHSVGTEWEQGHVYGLGLGLGHAGAEAQSGTFLSPKLPSEQNWRPTGMMRGSLVGRSYSPVVSQLLIQPSSAVATSTQARPAVQLPHPTPYTGGGTRYSQITDQGMSIPGSL